MEYFGNTLCISARELVESGIMTQPNYKQMVSRGRINVVRRGGGPECYALVAVDSLPTSYKEKVNEIYPSSDKVRLAGWVIANYERDQSAAVFFYDKTKTGVELTPEKANEYIINAGVLNTCIKLYDRASSARKLMGETYNWEMMATAIESLREQLGIPYRQVRFVSARK